MARVLVVEPEPDLHRLAEEALAELGHEAVLESEAHAGAQVDVVLLAPCGNMLALVTSLRDERRALPVVCTGNWPVSTEMRSLAPAAYLVKPYTLLQLDQALNQALAQLERS